MFGILEDYENRVYSQNGEDGVLSRIFSVIGDTNRYFVEFGTGADGSERNTRLLQQKGWTGLLMDQGADGNSFIRQEHITTENINGLFAKYLVPGEFDLLSIDVDGNDYWIWRALSARYRPRVVVIEYNAGIPPTESKSIVYDPDFKWQITDYFGASLAALAKLGKRKGYKLIYCESTGVNAFFVRDDLCPWEPGPVVDLYRRMAAWPHGGSFPRDPSRTMVDVENELISGVILARNEELNIDSCLKHLRPHVGEIILIDMESSDRTVELATPLVDKVLHHAVVPNFDAVRNIAISEANNDWLWFVDADEFVPDHVGKQIVEMVRTHGDEFEAINYPFATHFSGHWMRHCGWWGGYCTPRVLKRGHFQFSKILHRGVELQGREVRLPLDAAVPHYSFRDVEHWISKFNRYTSIEALQLAERGFQWNWRFAARALAHDLWEHYELNDAKLDGNQGWIVTWACSQYRWFTIAKLIDHFPDTPVSVPESLDEALQAIWDELAIYRASRPRLPLGLVLKTPLWDYSGYADEGRTFAKALARRTGQFSVEDLNWNSDQCELPPDEGALLRTLCRVRRSPYIVKITNCIPTLVEPDPGASVNILRTTFETDRIPNYWLSHIVNFDEIWVTSRFARDAFCRSWVPPEKVRVVESCIDTERFRPHGQKLSALPEQCTNRFVFLSVFDWQLRKGWDVLLRAYVTNFSPSEGVTLLLKVTCNHIRDISQAHEQAQTVLASANTSLEERPDILIWHQHLTAAEMADLYRSVDCFVLASRGEGWGRPYMEAMASGLPTIATIGSGNGDFMNEANCFIVGTSSESVPPTGAQEIPSYDGHVWLEPNIHDLGRQMRTAFKDAPRRESVRTKGLADVTAKFSLDAGRARIEHALDKATEWLKPNTVATAETPELEVVLEGEFFAGHSFANVNDQLAVEFSRRTEISLLLRRVVTTQENASPTHTADLLRPYFNRQSVSGRRVLIRHSFPPNWNPPNDGSIWVHIQPWELDYLPTDWIVPLQQHVNEIWVPSCFVRDVYLRSGIEAQKVHVIPWGVELDIFKPDTVPLLLPTQKSFRFLFVGGTIKRKGFDILLEAFRQEFDVLEDVCLVVKDQGTKSFYLGATSEVEIREAQSSADCAEIIYLDQTLTQGQLAGLYTACNCLVAPYRGEGFCLPALEAMSCGIPVIVPKGGPTDDFVSDEVGYVLPARKVETNPIGDLCGPATWNEVDIADVRRSMRAVFENRHEAQQCGARAAKFVRDNFTWKLTAQMMLDRARNLVHPHGDSNRTSEVAPYAAGDRKKPLLGLCIAVNQDEHHLASSLATIAPWVQEIIAISLSSTDRSMSIAMEYGAKVVDANCNDSEWVGLAMSHTSAEWVFVLYPGEQVPELVASKLKNLTSAVRPDFEAVAFDLRTDGFESASVVRQEIRLWRNKPHILTAVSARSPTVELERHGVRAMSSGLWIKLPTVPSPKNYTQIAEWWLLPWIPESGRSFIDIGANVGTWSKCLADRFDQVYSIEPDHDALTRLRDGLPKNVRVYDIGAWSCDEVIEFSQFAQSLHLSAYFHSEGINTGPCRSRIQHQCRAVDNLNLPATVDFIKCDTEGAEVECLLGAKNTILSCRPWLLVEVHSRENFAQLTKLLTEWNYFFTVIRDPHYEQFSLRWYEHCWLCCQHAEKMRGA